MNYIFPECLAIITFLPLGLSLGYVIYYDIHANNIPVSFEAQYLPFLVAICGSLLSATILLIIKLKAKKYVFEHLLVIMVGLLFFVAGSNNIMMKSTDPTFGFLLLFFGHGLCYIPVLVFVNIRTTAERRLTRISLAHASYLCGFALGTTLNLRESSLFEYILTDSDMNFNFAFILMNITVWIAVLFSIVEICRSKCVYKKSFDDDFQRINDDGVIFTLNNFHNVPSDENLKNSKQIKSHHLTPTSSESKIKQISRTLFAVASKITSLLCVFYSFHILNWNGTKHNFYIAPWVACAGALISSFCLKKFSLRHSFIVSCIIKIFGLLFLTYIRCNFIVWLSFFMFGFGYSYSDLNIIEFTSLKYNEIILWIGYSLEIIFIFVMDPYGWLNLSFNEIILNPYYIFGLVIILVILAIGAIVLVPNVIKKSILETKNILRMS